MNHAYLTHHHWSSALDHISHHISPQSKWETARCKDFRNAASTNRNADTLALIIVSCVDNGLAAVAPSALGSLLYEPATAVELFEGLHKFMHALLFQSPQCISKDSTEA